MKHSATGASVTTTKPRICAVPPVRTKNKGWSKQSSRRHVRFLWSVVPTRLSGICYSCTFTVLDTPPTPEIFAYWVKRYLNHLRKHYDLTRYHWVIEWQERGTPHLHMTFWFGGSTCSFAGHRTHEPETLKRYWDAIPHAKDLKNLWLHIAKKSSAGPMGQMVKEVDFSEIPQWIGYLAKHGARGVSNYQRNQANAPIEWQGSTGRVWGKGGSWPIAADVESHGLTKDQEYQYRRLFCRYLASNPAYLKIAAKSRKQTRQYWKSFLKCNDPKKSRFRSPASFIPIRKQLELVKCVQPTAYFVWYETGEIFDSPAECPIPVEMDWKLPPLPAVVSNMDDLDCN